MPDINNKIIVTNLSVENWSSEYTNKDAYIAIYLYIISY